MATLLLPPHSGPHSRPHFTHSLLTQSPPSPPMEESRISLPSISNLLGIADAGSPTNEHGSLSRRHSPQPDSLHQSSYFRPSSRPSSRHMHLKSSLSHHHHQTQHRDLPPTPPLSTDASSIPRSSPTKPTTQLPRPHHPAGYYHETTPPLDAEHQRSHHGPPPSAYSHPPPPPTSTSYLDRQHHQPQPSPSAYYQAPPPPAPSVGAAPPPTGLAYQRPLPQSFPPPPPAPLATTPAPVANPWQHHHYLSPSQGAPYPQAQDRYICTTCNKAFSRPSSLRIHSHSHTGEKPFKCPHSGCGKAFSVRSNMKRHERGCHSFEVSPGGPHLV
jgi:uncharacterized C2H2 Zn-finger protein